MNARHLFLLELDGERYALHLSAVSRVVRMVELSPLPTAPPSLLGLVNVQGEVLPVVNLRSLFRHLLRPPAVEDVLVIAGAAGRKLALAADAVKGVLPGAGDSLVADPELMRPAGLWEGVVRLPDGLVPVCDLEKILVACAAGPVGGEEAAPRPEPGEVPAGEASQGARRILRERALKLAREPEPEESAPRLELVEFLLSGERYAIESGFIREVYPLKELTPLPCTPPFVLGIVNIRGKILSVLDLRRFFELSDQGLSDLNKVLVLHQGGMEFGLLADAIVGVRTLKVRELKPTLPTLTEIRGEYLKGVTKERLVVLDAGKLLGDRRLVVHDEA